MRSGPVKIQARDKVLDMTVRPITIGVKLPGGVEIVKQFRIDRLQIDDDGRIAITLLSIKPPKRKPRPSP